MVKIELGHTKAGRILFIVWTPRRGLIRAVTAFPANHRTMSSYYKRKRNEKPADDQKQIDAEAIFVKDVYKDRARINRKAQAMLSEPIHFKFRAAIAKMRRQAASGEKDLKCQTRLETLSGNRYKRSVGLS